MALCEGDRVKIASEYGDATLPLHIDEALVPGQLFATFHDPSSRLNAVTGRLRDTQTDTPEYKLTAVRVERV